MPAKRIVLCLDIRGGRVVKGMNFGNLVDAGDPMEMALRCSEGGADELVLLNIDASATDTEVSLGPMIKKITKKISIPLTLGGGIKGIRDIERALGYGVDKVSINTATLITPRLITEAAKRFGSGRIVVAIDARRRQRHRGGWDVYIKGGRVNTGRDALKWAAQAEELGAGEILLTSIDRDGTGDGYDLELVKGVAECVNIPVIASGGAGTKGHVFDVLTKGKADAALIASLSHFNGLTLSALKDYLSIKGVPLKNDSSCYK